MRQSWIVCSRWKCWSQQILTTWTATGSSQQSRSTTGDGGCWKRQASLDGREDPDWLAETTSSWTPRWKTSLALHPMQLVQSFGLLWCSQVEASLSCGVLMWKMLTSWSHRRRKSMWSTTATSTCLEDAFLDRELVQKLGMNIWARLSLRSVDWSPMQRTLHCFTDLERPLWSCRLTWMTCRLLEVKEMWKNSWTPSKSTNGYYKWKDLAHHRRVGSTVFSRGILLQMGKEIWPSRSMASTWKSWSTFWDCKRTKARQSQQPLRSTKAWKESLFHKKMQVCIERVWAFCSTCLQSALISSVPSDSWHQEWQLQTVLHSRSWDRRCSTWRRRKTTSSRWTTTMPWTQQFPMSLNHQMKRLFQRLRVQVSCKFSLIVIGQVTEKPDDLCRVLISTSTAFSFGLRREPRNL